MAKKYLNLSKILKKLLFEKDIKAADLSRAVNMPHPTVHRLITGKSTRPYKSSLQPIADFFSITTDQLLGEAPLSEESMQKENNISTSLFPGKVRSIPLIPWGNVTSCKSHNDYTNVLFTGSIISEQSFASTLHDSSMEPMFSQGNILIFDPDKLPKDRSYVLVHLTDSNTLVFRQLIIDVEHKYLKTLNSDLQEHQIRMLRDTDRIIGILIESRVNFEYDT